MGAFIKFFQNILRLVVALAVFLFFGYMQHQYSAGIVATAILWIFLFRSGNRVISSLVALANMAAWYLGYKAVYVLTFLVLDSIMIFQETKGADDTKVTLRPYEAEVRKILFQNEPSLLHTVDTLLDEHKGREKELLYKLTKQYESGPLSIKTPPRSTQKITMNSSPFSASSPRAFTHQQQQRFEGNGTTPTGSSSGRDPMTPRTSYAATVLRIKKLLQQHDPAMLGSLDRMLEEYRGREQELLLEIQAEYEVATNSTSDTAAAATATAVASPAAALSGVGRYGYGYTSDPGYQSASQQLQQHRVQSFSPPGSATAATAAASPRGYFSNSGGGQVQQQRQQPEGGTFSAGYSTQPRQQQQQQWANRQQHHDEGVIDSGDEDNGGSSRMDYTPPVTHGRGPGVATAQLQRNEAVRHAQEEARREMHARIDARWGAKPPSSATKSVQKRHGYSYGD